MSKANNYHIKANRIFTPIRKYAWLFTVLVAIGGLWIPKLGLLVFLIMVGLLAVSFLNGRYWCGNVCPHGSLFDRIILPYSRNTKIPDLFKSKPFVVLFFIFFVFNLSRKMLKALQAWGTYDFLDKLGFVFVMTYLVVMLIGGVLAIVATPRTWCQFCPMGSLQKMSYTVSKAVGVAQKNEKKLTIAAKDMCHTCGKCARVCPFQLNPYLEFNGNNQLDNPNCIKCTTCVENCPANILSFETAEDALKLKEATSLEGYEDRQKIQSEIIAINDLDEGIKEYVFKFVTPEKVDYKAGQFILVKIQANPVQYRAYSISSFNEDGTQLSAIIKKVENGYGTGIIFNEFKIGDMVELEGPMGDELVLDRDAEKMLFVANGIGITPFIALAKDVVLNSPDTKEVKLLAGQRYEKELLYHEHFLDLEEQHDHFEYVPFVSRDRESELNRGYVTDHLLKMGDLKGYKVYMCGSKNMIMDSHRILLEKGVRSADIFYESEERIAI